MSNLPEWVDIKKRGVKGPMTVADFFLSKMTKQAKFMLQFLIGTENIDYSRGQDIRTHKIWRKEDTLEPDYENMDDDYRPYDLSRAVKLYDDMEVENRDEPIDYFLLCEEGYFRQLQQELGLRGDTYGDLETSFPEEMRNKPKVPKVKKTKKK